MRQFFLKFIIILLVISIVGTGVIVFIDTSIPVESVDLGTESLTLSGE